jgi:hypothetical protein
MNGDWLGADAVRWWADHHEDVRRRRRTFLTQPSSGTLEVDWARR